MQVTAGPGVATAVAPPGAAETSAAAAPASSSSVADYHSLTDPAVSALLDTATPLGAEVSLCHTCAS